MLRMLWLLSTYSIGICFMILLITDYGVLCSYEKKSEEKHQKKDKPGENSALIVETKTGKIQGYSMHALNHEIHVFDGIPYAMPPVGHLRFRKPVPVEKWNGILNATKKPNSCYQETYDYFPGFKGEQMWNANTELSEDCLYLSIWVPQKIRFRHHGGNHSAETTRKKVPVLIWIYGGGYISGTATLDVYTSAILASFNNAIVASMQYRVGAFGFLYLSPMLNGNGEAPGNMGLWDQKMAIEWIKDNIEAFGGDPNLITLFGESAGAGSVTVHLVSPVTKGLVNRGILQSGTMNAPWSYMTGEKALEIGLTLVDDCGCNSSQIVENPSGMMSCMRRVDSKTISKRQWNTYWGILGFPTAPTIDGVFLTKDPMEMVKEGDFSDKQIIIGSNLNEGTYFLLYDFIDYFQKDGPISLSREKFLELINKIFKQFSDLQKEAIIFHYTDWENVHDGYLNQHILGEIVGDYFFICPSNLFANVFSDRGATVYYYYFIQRTSMHYWGEWMGVIHGDEVAYVFGEPLNATHSYNARERDLSIRIMQSFTRFAINGKPAPDLLEWPPYTSKNPLYYLFSTVKHGTGRGPRLTACQFWNNLMPKIRSYAVDARKGCGLVKADQEKYKTNGICGNYKFTNVIVFSILLCNLLIY